MLAPRTFLFGLSLGLSTALVVRPLDAQAQDADSTQPADSHSASGLDDLLGNLPDIENPDANAAPEEKDVGPDVPFTTYVDQVRARVLAAWKPKSGLVKKDPSLETRLVLSIAEDGAVVSLMPMVLSGNKKFDQDAVDAINDAGDMPAPAANLKSLADEGVVVIFSARSWLTMR